jgi:hypothetical protein
VEDEVLRLSDLVERVPDVESLPAKRGSPREGLGERGPELAAGARYEDAWESRSERIGLCVFHR